MENAHFQTEFLVKISKKKNSSNRVNLSLGLFLISSAQSCVRHLKGGSSQGGLKVTDDNDAEKISQNHHLVR